MKFGTKYDYKPDPGETNEGIRITERAGYVPPKKQIEDMIFAGQRLNAARKEQYDFESDADTDNVSPDPTRGSNFDLADATRLQRSAQNALGAQKRAFDEFKLEKASKLLEGADKAPKNLLRRYKA